LRDRLSIKEHVEGMQTELSRDDSDDKDEVQAARSHGIILNYLSDEWHSYVSLFAIRTKKHYFCRVISAIVF
jgi:hypothetical protein